MNKYKLFLILAAVLCFGFSGLRPASGTPAALQTYTLDWCVVGGGGNVGTRLDSTVGQTAIGWSTGARQLGSGFWYGVGGGYEIYLPLTMKHY